MNIRNDYRESSLLVAENLDINNLDVETYSCRPADIFTAAQMRSHQAPDSPRRVEVPAATQHPDSPAAERSQGTATHRRG